MSLYIPRSIIPGDDLKTLIADSYSSFERPDVLSICSACGGPMKIIASIEDSFVIGKILSHLEARYCLQGPENRRPGARGPPPAVC